MMLLFHGSVVGWFPALSPLSHLQLIIPSLSFFFPGSSPLIRLCLFPFFHCFNASCQIECLRVTTLSFLDYRALQGLCFLSETPPPPFFFFNFLSHFFFFFSWDNGSYSQKASYSKPSPHPSPCSYEWRRKIMISEKGSHSIILCASVFMHHWLTLERAEVSTPLRTPSTV